MKWPANRISQSSTKSFGMYEKAVGLMSQGIDLIHLEVGRPNFDTPDNIKEATKKALDDGIVHYGDFRGELKFREALVKKLKTKNKIDVDADEILITAGLTHGAFITCMAALDDGDEVILIDPYYPQHVNKIELAGAKVVHAAFDKSNNFYLDPKNIEAKITSKTKMIALVNPTNPTGRVYSREELQGLADLAIKHDLLIMSDEVYEQILFDDNEHISIASLDGMAERTISLFAFTKGYAMDGWRMGYAVANKNLMPALLKISMNDLAHVNVFIQEGGYAAITDSQEAVEKMVAEDLRCRDMVCERLNQMKNVSCTVPQASIYAFPDISKTGLTSQDIADKILNDVQIVVESGAFYGESGEGHLRVCFGAESYERIETAMDRLDEFFSSL